MEARRTLRYDSRNCVYTSTRSSRMSSRTCVDVYLPTTHHSRAATATSYQCRSSDPRRLDDWEASRLSGPSPVSHECGRDVDERTEEAAVVALVQAVEQMAQRRDVPQHRDHLGACQHGGRRAGTHTLKG